MTGTVVEGNGCEKNVTDKLEILHAYERQNRVVPHCIHEISFSRSTERLRMHLAHRQGLAAELAASNSPLGTHSAHWRSIPLATSSMIPCWNAMRRAVD